MLRYATVLYWTDESQNKHSMKFEGNDTDTSHVHANANILQSASLPMSRQVKAGWTGVKIFYMLKVYSLEQYQWIVFAWHSFIRS
jgi:hypothetical protein